MAPRFKKIVSDLSNHFDWIKQYGQYYDETVTTLVKNGLYTLLKYLESSIASAVPVLMTRPKRAKKFADFMQTSLADLKHIMLVLDLKPDEASSVLSALGKILTHYVTLMLNSKTIEKEESKEIADDIHDLLRQILRESPQHVLDVILILTHETPEHGSVSFYLMKNVLEDWESYATNTDCIKFMKFLGICKVFYDGVKKNKTFVKKILARIGSSPRGFSKALKTHLGIRVQVKGSADPDDVNLLEYLWVLNIMKVVKLSKKSLTVDSLPTTGPIDDDSDDDGDEEQEGPAGFFIDRTPFLPNNEPDGDPQESNCMDAGHRIQSELTNGHITLENLTVDTELDNIKASEPKLATTVDNREPPSEKSESTTPSALFSPSSSSHLSCQDEAGSEDLVIDSEEINKVDTEEKVDSDSEAGMSGTGSIESAQSMELAQPSINHVEDQIQSVIPTHVSGETMNDYEMEIDIGEDGPNEDLVTNGKLGSGPSNPSVDEEEALTWDLQDDGATITQELNPQDDAATITQELNPQDDAATITQELNPQDDAATITQELNPQDVGVTQDLNPQDVVITQELNPQDVVVTHTQGWIPQDAVVTQERKADDIRVTPDLNPRGVTDVEGLSHSDITVTQSVFEDNISSDSDDDVQVTEVKFQDKIPSDSVDCTERNSEVEGSGSDSEYTEDSDVQEVIFANSFSVPPDDLPIPVTEILPNVSAGAESSDVVGSYRLAAETFDDEDEGSPPFTIQNQDPHNGVLYLLPVSSDLNQPKLAGIIDLDNLEAGQSSSYGRTNSNLLPQPLHASIPRKGPEPPDGDSDSDIEIVAHLNADEEEVEEAAGQFNDRDEAPSDSDEAPYCKSRSPSPPSEPENRPFTRRSTVQPHVNGFVAIPSTIYRIKEEPKSPQHESEDALEYSSYVCDDYVLPFPENFLNIPAPDPDEATISICNLTEENHAGQEAEAFYGIRTRSSKRTRSLCSSVGYQEEEAPEEKKKSCPDPALMLPIEARNLRSRNPSESSTPASPFTTKTPQRKSTSRRNGYSSEAERHVETRSSSRRYNFRHASQK